MSLPRNGKAVTIDSLIKRHLLTPTLREVTASDLGWYQPWDRKERVALIHTTGLKVDEFRRWIVKPATRRALAKAVLPLLLEHYGDRKVKSFYCKDREDGWYAWPDYPWGAYKGKHPKGAMRVPTPAGDVWVEFGYYKTEDKGAKIGGWRGTLVDANHNRLAVAAGMCFVPRSLFCGPSEWLRIADEISDFDIMLVLAMMEQFPQFASGLSDGVGVLEVWDRHFSAPKGCGAVVLKATLEAIKRKEPRLHQFVAHVEPSQFVQWLDDGDPLPIRLAKRRARDKIIALVEEHAPEWEYEDDAKVPNLPLILEQTVSVQSSTR